MEDARRKRRAVAHGQTACDPCRLRKVRCSYQSPCQTCIDREHPELCVYGALAKRIQIDRLLACQPQQQLDMAQPISVPSWPPSRQDWDSVITRVNQLERALPFVQTQASPRTTPRSVTDAYGDMYARHAMTGESIFLGGNSVVAMAAALVKSDKSDIIQGLIGQSILPIFALENDTITYPFVDILATISETERIQRLCALLPVDSESFGFLRQYRDNAHVLFPAIIDIEQFEAQVIQFLMMRAQASALPPSEQSIYGQNLHWLGLFFACIASGCQCSTIERKQRQLTSQVYVCCAYECLRLTNFLSCSTLDDIQTLLILGNVISNNMNAGVAWTLLGLTIRLAQGLGLHHQPPTSASDRDTSMRYHIWCRIVWQDSLLSISYDRATYTTSMTKWGSVAASEIRRFTYADCMLQLSRIALDVVSSRETLSNDEKPALQTREHMQKIMAIEEKAVGHLREISACTSRTQLLEHWSWRLHRSYLTCELCRPVLTDCKGANKTDDRHCSLCGKCVAALTNTIEGFLNLQALTSCARTSWAAVHRSLSSALLLAILKEPGRNETVRKLIDTLIIVLSSKEYEAAGEISTPVARAIAALSRLSMAGDQSSARDDSSSKASSPHRQMYEILWGPRGQVKQP